MGVSGKEKVKRKRNRVSKQKLYPPPLSELKLPFVCTIRPSQTGMPVECTALP